MGATKGSTPLLLLRKSRDPVSAAKDVLCWTKRHGIANGKAELIVQEWKRRAADGYDIMFEPTEDDRIRYTVIKVPDGVPHLRNGPPTLALHAHGDGELKKLDATAWVKEYSGRGENDPMNEMEIDSILLAHNEMCRGYGANGMMVERDANLKIVSSSFKSFGYAIRLSNGNDYPTIGEF